MASRPFAEISDQEIENLIERAIPDKMRKATKYGKVNVHMRLTENFV